MYVSLHFPYSEAPYHMGCPSPSPSPYQHTCDPAFCIIVEEPAPSTSGAVCVGSVVTYIQQMNVLNTFPSSSVGMVLITITIPVLDHFGPPLRMSQYWQCRYQERRRCSIQSSMNEYVKLLPSLPPRQSTDVIPVLDGEA